MVSIANRDDAFRCLQLSKEYSSRGEFDLAFKYARKAVSLYDVAELRDWLENVQSGLDLHKAGKESAEEPPNSTTRARQHSNAAQGKSASPLYTSEQVDDLRRFMTIDRNDFYAVLNIGRDASEADIKKAYRRLALQYHPDKNQAPGADEAFKTVGRAFAVLGNPQKKAGYDAHGIGADSSEVGSSKTSARFGQHAFHYDQDISPEDLFNMFFGTAANGMFTASPGATYTFYSNAGSYGRRHRRAQPMDAAAEQQQFLANLLQWIPILILLFVSFISQFFGGGNDA